MLTFGVGAGSLSSSLRETGMAAAAAERAGAHTVWTGEFYTRSAVVALGEMARATTRCRIGSSIAYAVGRSPLVLATEARGLDEISEGRLVLGLGTGTRRMMSGWHGADPEGPATRLEELIPLLRRIWRLHEEPVRHDGRFYRVDLAPTERVPAPVRDRIPVFTAGVNPRMVEVAGRVSDGLLGHPLFTVEYLAEVVRPAIEAGARRTERDPADVEIVAIVICSVSDDEELARHEAASQIAFYSTAKTYGRMLEHAGFVEPVGEIREAFRRGDHRAMVDAVPDEMVDALSVTGTAERVRSGLDRFEGLADHVLLMSPLFTVAPERVAENAHALVELAGRGNEARRAV